MKEKVLVMGLGKSGVAAAELLAGEAQVSAWDSKPEDDFDKETVERLRSEGVRLIFGAEPEEHFDRVVMSPGIAPSHPLSARLAAEGSLISGELEEGFRHCEGTFFAITGTNGKTTTTALAGEMVKEAGIPCEVVGNIGLPACARVRGAGPETVLVTEVSSFQLETVHSFSPKVSAVLNVTPDHLNRHGTFEEYARVKGLVFEYQQPGTHFVYNAEDPECVKLAEKASAKGIIAVPFSSRRILDFGAYVEDGVICIADDDGVTKFCRVDELQIPGRHNTENALAAAAVCFFGGVDPEAITKALKAFKGVEHRIEFVRELGGVRYVNDSKGTNPDSTIKAIEATDTPILLIAGGYEKNSDFTELIQNFGGKVKYLLLLGVTAKRFAECAVKNGFPQERIVFCKDMDECVANGSRLAEPGDTVLLSPASASWDMYKSYEHRGDHFKELVNRL